MSSEPKKPQPPRSIRLTPEGWIFVGILGFVFFGSVLRSVNLLILLSGMMFSAIILNWRSAIHRLRSIDAHRTIPNRIFAGRLTSVVWHCHNHHRSHVAFSVNIEDRIDSAAPQPPAPDEPRGFIGRLRQRISDSVNRLRRVGPHQVRLNLRTLLPASTQSTVYQTWFEQRGLYHAGPGEITSTFPFGLIEIRIPLTEQTSVYVAPALGKISPDWDERSNAMLTGSDSSTRKRGNEDDQFFALRRWRSGDEPKKIHWRATARTGAPMVRQFDQSSARDVALVVELFQDDIVADQDIETLLSFATTAAVQLGPNLHGQMAIALCGQQCESFRHLTKTEVNQAFLKAAALAQSSPDPDLFRGIKNAGQAVSRGTPIFVISSRPEPIWVRQLANTDERKLDSHQNDIFRTLAMPDMAIGRLTEMIHWMDISSDNFQSLYTAPGQRDQASVDKFVQRWGR